MSGDVTELLARWAHGDRAALDDMMPVVYSELRRIADAYLRRERSGHTLQPTALVHEAWMRLIKQERPSLTHRKHFFALAAQIMRRILVDHARATQAQKRGGDVTKTQLDEVAAASPHDTTETIELLALDEALSELGRVDARQAQVIEMKYFGGLTLEELADVLGVSAATISRDQRAAEAWLSHALADGRSGA